MSSLQELKGDFYAVTNMGVEISKHVQIFIPLKVSFF